MASYHLNIDFVRRGKGHSATAAAAYRAGEDIRDERTGKTHYYSNRKGVFHAEIMTPEHIDLPEWTKDRAKLWNHMEVIDLHPRSQPAKSARMALPRELDLEQQKKLVRDFVKDEWTNRGMIADIALHEFGGHNPHAHVLLTTREWEGDSFGNKNREWNSKKNLKDWRRLWSEYSNRELKKAGFEARIDHRSLKAQGIDRVPQVHRGKDATALIRKNQPTPRIEKAEKIRDSNNAFRNAANQEVKHGNYKEADERNLQKALERKRQRTGYRRKATGEREWERYLSKEQQEELVQREGR